jgi:ubiquinone/menaquinone biosynthesis C-methylase UbiE
MVAIAGFTKEQIFAAVRQMYGEVATAPLKQFHFPTGRDACRFVGYPDAWLDRIPATAVESFAGVGFPFRAGVIRPGDTVLDIGSGSGTDALLAAGLAGPQGRVIALDITPAMLEKLRRNVAAAGVTNVEILEGNAEAIPLPNESVDVVTTNGVLNLVPDKAKAFAEIFRVLRPGGRVQVADIMLARPVGDVARKDPRLWAECVVGASLEDDYLGMFRAVGFADVKVLRRYDYFSGSASADTRRIAGALGAMAAEITMHRSDVAGHGLLPRLRRFSPLFLGRRMAQHGHLGLFATGGAIFACYGSLALVAALSALGLSVPLYEGAWAAAIVALTALAPVGLALNWRVHRGIGPLAVVAVGAALVLYAILGSYDWRVEAAGFAAMLGATLWDRRKYRTAIGC